MADSERVDRKVGDIAAPVRNALVGGPFGSDLKTADYVAYGVPVVRGQNLSVGKYVGGEFVYVSGAKADRLAANLAKPGDLVFTQRGNAVLQGGQVALVPDGPYDRYLVSQSQMKLTPDRARVDAVFLYYVFLSPDHREYLRNNAIVTGVPHTNLGLLRDYRLSLPPLRQQQAIAHILGTLDDKIELDRRMNETLEGMARAIFKSWFVDFDPVRAKADGRQPTGMDPATAALFPDSFEDSSLGKIPKGWKAAKFGDVISVFDSKRIPLSGREREKRRGMYPYYGAASVMDYVDDYLFDGVYVLMGEDGSVINDDGTPVLQYVWDKFWVNNHAHVLQGSNGVSTEHLLLHLKECNIAPYVTGAVQPKLNQGNMNRIDFVLPTAPLSHAFAQAIAPLFAQFRFNREQSIKLALARDALLPRLLSGEIRVPEAEQHINMTTTNTQMQVAHG